ncbi:hypothetical protein HOLleu_24376 [Holothuria leucospilota]|uniref:Uncharacterized protein n=1 Tax=Holothuria leucospilota TaxID=206669 RepID=A0A9Q1H697_HOLLE|nr:hypothetical protein HOLleu_24376 [Holothuria leucospilota]
MMLLNVVLMQSVKREITSHDVTATQAITGMGSTVPLVCLPEIVKMYMTEASLPAVYTI